MEREWDEKASYREIYSLNVLLLLVHIVFFTFFKTHQVNVMAVANVMSMLVYLCNFWMLYQRKVSSFLWTTCLEIMIHMFLAVLCVGWNSGFQLYFIASETIIFYADYFAVHLQKEHIKTIPLCLGSAVCYFLGYFHARAVEPIYVLDDSVTVILHTVNGLAVFFVCTFYLYKLFSSAHLYETELVHIANYDKLTKLANRRYMLEWLDNLYNAGRLNHQWLAILDIDNFKSFNDQYGHNCGDFVLQETAKIIARNSGSYMTCRWGGEEFLVEGNCTSDGKIDYHLLENIRRAIEQYEFDYEDKKLHLTVTIGAVKYETDQSINQWIDEADKKLYLGKKTGKNRLVV